jgi:RNA polymerase sigma-70 factor (ECF subfamily)
MDEGHNAAIGPFVEALILSPAEGKRDTDFAARVQEAQQRVFQIAYSVLADVADAEEVAQDAFIRAYRRLPNLREPDKFLAWVSRISFRLALNRRRDQRRRLVRDAAWYAGRPDTVVDGARKGIDRVILDRVRMEIDRLPAKLRMVLLLSAVDGMEAREVAEVLNIPVGTVRSRLYLARKRLLEVTER